MNERPLTGWLLRRRESATAKQVREHLTKVLDSTQDLDTALGHCLRDDRTRVRQALARLDMNEKAADNLEVDLFRTLARGDLEPKQREDLLLLVRRVDDISDYVKQAGLNLQLLLEWQRRVPRPFWVGLKEMTKDLVDTTRALKGAVDAFGQEEKVVLDRREEVNRLEHRIDGEYFELKRKLIRSSPDPRAMALLMDIVNGIEAAADTAKEAADQLLILVLGGR